MKAIIVDGERLGIRQFQMEAEGIEGVEIAGAFPDPCAKIYLQEMEK